MFMHSSLKLTTLFAAVAFTVSAGTIATVQTQIGGPNGLTAAYIGSANQGGWVERNYDYYLFNGVLTASPGTNYEAKAGTTNFPATPPNSTLTDSTSNALTDSSTGVTFAMLDDGCGGTPPAACTNLKTNNTWVSSFSGGPSTITIPIGIFSVDDLWAIVNNEFGASGSQDTTFEFDFGSGPTTADGATLILNLTNSSNSTGNTGQIRTGTTSTNGSCASCSVYANLSTASSSTVNNVTVLSDRIFSQSYTSLVNPNVPYTGSTAGSVVLNDVGFQFGNTYQGVYLVDVKVTDNTGYGNGTGTSYATGNYLSQTALSAITVDSTVPEPSTLAMLLVGFGLTAVMLIRRRSAAI
jgi:hypothetical protein